MLEEGMPQGDSKKTYQILRTLIKTGQHKTSVIETANIIFI